MEEPSLPFDKLKSKSLKILVLVIVIYGILIIFLYHHYQNEVKAGTTQILEEYSNKILKLTVNKISTLTNSIKSQDISIKTSVSDIQVCSSDNTCMSYNILRLGKLIDEQIPDFIHYKIKLNRNFLYTNAKAENYQTEKIYQLSGSNQLSISVAIDYLFQDKLRAEKSRPLWMLSLCFIANILLLYGLIKLAMRSCESLYTMHFEVKYTDILKQLQSDHNKELNNIQVSSMDKIWNLEFKKQRDLEINCLFAEEAVKLALSSLKRKPAKSASMLPCSIVLHQNDKMEEINVAELIGLFTKRFDQESDNILLYMVSKTAVVHFSSKIALYQIIYSLISFLFFVLSKQPSSGSYNIKLIIDKTINSYSTGQDGAHLCFEYDGSPVNTEKGLFQMAGHFFKTHANPFILNIDQVFAILKNSGFDCKITYDCINVIDILHKKELKDQRPRAKSNVIFLSSFMENKK